MRGIVQRFVAVLMTVCLAWVVSGGSTATAAVVMPDVTDEIASLAARAERYMERNLDGTYSLTATAKELGVSQAAVDRFTSVLNAVNQGIVAGYFTTDTNGQLQLTESGKRLYLNQAGDDQRVTTCTPQSKRMTANETSRFEGLLNMYSAGTVGVLALVTFMAILLTGAGALLLAIALVAAILGAGAYFFASWMQSVDRGSGVTIHWTRCTNVFEPIGGVWPTGN